MQFSEIQQVKQRFGIIGSSEALSRAIDIAVQVANTDLSVLIQGESGVGKETFPQIIHQHSHRKHKKYFAINCGAIPEGTIDSELFGHEKGAFTTAVNERRGYFEEADGGTVFLDEVGELPLSTQVRLLRVLEAGEFMRVGSSKVQKTNVRVVAATNVNMQQAIAEGQFREDLYYRLNAVPIYIPPLRERKEDIGLLFRKFSTDFAEKYQMPAVRLTDEAMELLKNYYWRGNVRQLKNVTEQISVIEQNREIDHVRLRIYLPEQERSNLPAIFKPGDKEEQKSFNNEREILYQVLFDMKRDVAELKKLVHSIMAKENMDLSSFATSSASIFNETSNANTDMMSVIHTPQPTMPTLLHDDDDHKVIDTEEYIEESLSLIDAERDMIIKALERHNGKRKYAAQDLHISERTLYRKIKEFGLEK